MLYITKIFHTIRLGDTPYTPSKLKNIQTWFKRHPAWKHMHWDDAALAGININVPIKERGLDRSGNLWLRSKILNIYGGVFIETDMQCLRNIDELVEESEIFFSLDEHRNISFKIIGSRPLHPVIDKLSIYNSGQRGGHPITAFESSQTISNSIHEILGKDCEGIALENADTQTLVATIFAHGIYLYEPWIFGLRRAPNKESRFAKRVWRTAWEDRIRLPNNRAQEKFSSLSYSPHDGDIVIIIPTINQKDSLLKSVNNLLSQSEFFLKIIIIDNGNQNLVIQNENVQVLTQDHNLGVAASWNLGIRLAMQIPSVTHCLILNDDIILGSHQLSEIANLLKFNLDTWLFVGTCEWAVFVLSRECSVALELEPGIIFDETFYPAYFEDTDFHYRFMQLYPERYKGNLLILTPLVVRRSMSTLQDPSLASRFANNGYYYIEKWGGGPGSEKTPANN